MTYLVHAHLYLQPPVIGGPEIIVELDESKFHLSNGRGPEAGFWVFGGVERTPERRCFFTTVANRTEMTLRGLINRHVAFGSDLHTDGFRSYNTTRLTGDGYRHSSVNHSLGFRDPITGAHTNTIEGTWAALKRIIPPRVRGNLLNAYLAAVPPRGNMDRPRDVSGSLNSEWRGC